MSFSDHGFGLQWPSALTKEMDTAKNLRHGTNPRVHTDLDLSAFKSPTRQHTLLLRSWGP